MVSVTIDDAAAATTFLRNEIVPRVKQALGFVASYWVRLEGGDQGRGTNGDSEEESESGA